MLESSGARFAIWVVFGCGFWLEWSLAETYGLGETLFLARWESKRTHGPILLIFGCIWLAVLMLGLSWVAATSYGSLGQIWYGSLSLGRGLMALVSSPCDSRF